MNIRRLRDLVPTLGAIACASSFAVGAENGTNAVAIGGFVDTIGSVADTREDGASAAYDFAAAAELRLGYQVNDRVGVKVEAEWNNTNTTTGTTSTDSESYNGHPGVYVEQAFVNYVVDQHASVTMGKFDTYAGWVAPDADGLYRINYGPITRLYGGHGVGLTGGGAGTELVGAVLNYAPFDRNARRQIGIDLLVTNGLGLVDVNDRTNDNGDQYLSPALDVKYQDDWGKVDAELGWDYHGRDLAVWAAGLNATVKPGFDKKLTLGGELLAQRVVDDLHGDTKRYGALGMINHGLPTIGKVTNAVTLMGQVVRISSSTTGASYNPFQSSLDGFFGGTSVTTGRTEVGEVALAWLTNPTGASEFGLNLELSASVLRNNQATYNDDHAVKSVWAGIELIAVIP